MASTLLIENARVFTGVHLLPMSSVLIVDGLVAALDPSLSEIPANIPTINAAGKTLLPGLIDAHIHANNGQVLAIEQALKFGVTTVLDMHNEPQHVHALKEVARERNDVADFLSACYGATIEGGWPEPVVTAHDKSAEVSLFSKWRTSKESD